MRRFRPLEMSGLTKLKADAAADRAVERARFLQEVEDERAAADRSRVDLMRHRHSRQRDGRSNTAFRGRSLEQLLQEQESRKEDRHYEQLAREYDAGIAA